MEPHPLANLAEFDACQLAPSSSAFTRALYSRAKAYSFAELLSDYFWLILGLDAGYFPEQHVQAVFAQRFTQFISELRELYSTWGYVFDPEFGPLLEAAYNYRRPIQREERLRVHDNPISKAAIRAALIAEYRLQESTAARTFLSLLCFEPEVLVRVMASGEAMGGSDEGNISQYTVGLGFRDTVSYMETLVGLSHALYGEQEEIVAKRCDYRLRQLTRWRINRHAAVDGLFKRVALFVNFKFLDGAYPESKVIYQIDELLGYWGFTHLKAATA
jgi:hypothetical protein